MDAILDFGANVVWQRCGISGVFGDFVCGVDNTLALQLMCGFVSFGPIDAKECV